jgi:hypothetical protein
VRAFGSSRPLPVELENAERTIGEELVVDVEIDRGVA